VQIKSDSPLTKKDSPIIIMLSLIGPIPKQWPFVVMR